VGRLIEKRQHKTETLFADFVHFATRLLNNVSYNKRTIADFYTEIRSDMSEEFTTLFDDFLSGKTLTHSVVLTKQQRQYIASFLSGLNSVNSAALSDHLTEYIDYFKQTLDTVRNNNAKTGKIFPKLGLLSGVILGIMLI
jgi:hypothetical protein